MANPVRDLMGKEFGFLEVVSRAENKKGNSNAQWLCLCFCGKSITVSANHLIDGSTKSCGCKRYVRLGTHKKNVQQLLDLQRIIRGELSPCLQCRHSHNDPQAHPCSECIDMCQFKLKAA